MPGLLRRRRQGLFSGASVMSAPAIAGSLSADLVVAGLEAATFTRSTTKTFTDYEGILRTAAVNEAVFEGGRRVENLCKYSDPSSADQLAYTSSINVTVQVGGITQRNCVNSIIIGDNSLQRVLYVGGTVASPITLNTYTTYLFSCIIKMDDGNAPIIGTSSTDSTIDFVGRICSSQASLVINTPVHLGGGEYLVSYFRNTGSSVSNSYTGFIKYVGNSNRSFKCSGFQVTDISNSTHTLPSVYVPTSGAASSRWFTTKPDGSPIYPVPKLLMEGQSQNKITAKTANPVDTTGVTKSGDAAAVLSVVDDAAALAAAGLSATCSSGKVYKLDNSAGTGISYVVVAGLTGNTNVHTFSLYVRGSSVVRLYESGDIQRSDNITLTSAYQRSKWSFTPTDANRSSGLRVPAGAIVYFILLVFEELAVVSSVIPNDTGSALTRTADACSWPLSAELQAMLSIDKAWTTSLADETGLTWGAEKNQSSFADGQSWFDHPDKDLSAFVNSGKMMILRDSSGRLAWGFIGVAGTGQTFGPEKLQNGDMSSATGWSATNWNIGGGVATHVPGAASSLFQAPGILDKRLYKASIELISNTVGTVGIRLCTIPTVVMNMSSNGVWNYYVAGVNDYIARMAIPSIDSNAVVDNASVKEVLSPSTKGVYIYKDAARTQQGWNMEASFNMNDTSYTFDVVADCKAEGTVVLDWVPGYSGSDVNFTSAVRELLSVGDYSRLIYRIEGTDVIDYCLSHDKTGATTNSFDTVNNILFRLIVRFSSHTRTFQIAHIKGNVLSLGTISPFDGSYSLGTLLELHKSNGWPCKYSDLKFFKRWLTDNELMRLK